MRMSRLVRFGTCGAVLGWFGLAHAAAPEPSWRDFKHVSNTSFVEPSGDKALQLSVEVPASAHDVFQAFATSDGFSSWAVPIAKVDLKIGGFIEASYDASVPLGSPSNIKNQIVAYLPDRLLVIRNVQAPPGFVDQTLFARTVTIIELHSLGERSTRVTLTNAGYGPGEGFADVYRHFEWGDAYTLEELRKRFVDGPTDWAKEAAKEQAKKASDKVEGAH
ncbi:MAG TPA: SRPBCC domain-containing protein [Steroidobacteraceae bacterium]